MKPPAVIVNEKDEVIGLKLREEVDPKDDIYRVSSLWITNSAGEILIAQRKLTKKQAPGKWGPAVAGTVEEGETYESNIYKEAEEEIGLVGYEFKLGPKERISGYRNYFVQWFTVVVDKPINFFRIEETEVEQITWIPQEELASEVQEAPEKYVTPMPGAIKLFCNGR